MITYLMTAYLYSFAWADDPDASTDSSNETTEETQSSAMPAESTEDNITTDTSEELPIPVMDTDTEPSPSDKNENSEEPKTEYSSAGPTLDEHDESKANIDADGEETLSVDEDITTDIEQMMSEIMEEMANSEENTLEMGLEAEVNPDDEEFNYKGNIEYSYVLTIWDSPERNIFHVAQFSGDPQYLFRKTEQWGYTLGARFQVSGSELLEQKFYNSLIGVTGGLQYGAFRINTSASWMWEQYFAQKELDRADGFITYQYDELEALSGVLWENTLTYSPDDMDFGIQATVGFPFQVSGERNMGQPFEDSWQVGTRLNISFLQLGYTHILYPGHSIQRIQIGSGILF